MNEQAVIDYMKHYLDDEVYIPKCVEAHKIAIEIIERQIPKKPLEIREKHDFNGNVILKDGYCPICKNELSNSYVYCNHCGNRMDWN